MVHGYDCVKPHSTIVWLFIDFLLLTSKLDHIMSWTVINLITLVVIGTEHIENLKYIYNVIQLIL